MPEFLAALMAFPTVIFTCLMGLLLPYWVTVIAGVLDLDLFHLGGGHHDGDVAHGDGGSHGFLDFFSFGKVPLTITVSVFVVLSWLLCMFAELALRAPLSSLISGPLFSLLLGPAAVIPALMMTSLAVRPLRGVFTLHTEHGEAGLVGRMVRISSRTVDKDFGTATCDVAGPDILLNVICRDGVVLARDDMAVVVEYDAARQVYLVAPFSHLSPDAGVLGVGLPPALPPPVSTPSPAQTSSKSLVSPASTPVTPVSLERQHERPH